MQKQQRDECDIEISSVLGMSDYSRKEVTATYVTASQGWGIKTHSKVLCLSLDSQAYTPGLSKLEVSQPYTAVSLQSLRGIERCNIWSWIRVIRLSVALDIWWKQMKLPIEEDNHFILQDFLWLIFMIYIFRNFGKGDFQCDKLYLLLLLLLSCFSRVRLCATP